MRNPSQRFLLHCKGLRIGVSCQIGAHGVRETPVPIPNTEVKPRSGYNTWVIKPWENSTVPNYRESLRDRRLFLCLLFQSSKSSVTFWSAKSNQKADSLLPVLYDFIVSRAQCSDNSPSIGGSDMSSSQLCRPHSLIRNLQGLISYIWPILHY